MQSRVRRVCLKTQIKITVWTWTQFVKMCKVELRDIWTARFTSLSTLWSRSKVCGQCQWSGFSSREGQNVVCARDPTHHLSTPLTSKKWLRRKIQSILQTWMPVGTATRKPQPGKGSNGWVQRALQPWTPPLASKLWQPPPPSSLPRVTSTASFALSGGSRRLAQRSGWGALCA